MRKYAFDRFLVHPSVRAFPGVASKHRAFAAGQIIGAALAALAGGIYAWLTGPLLALEIIAFGWLLSPAIMAAYIRATGNLPRAQLIWVINLTALISFLAGVTGGLTSFLIPWLLVVPAEAVLSNDKRLIPWSAALCLAALLVLLGVSQAGYLPEPLVPSAQATLLYLLGPLGAVIYVTAVAFYVQRTHAASMKIARDDEARYRFLAENATDLITRHDPNGRIVYASPASKRMLGISTVDLVGDLFEDLVCEADVERVKGGFSQAAASRRDVRIEYKIRHKSGRLFWVETSCSASIAYDAKTLFPTPHSLPLPSCYEIICITRNIDERKQYEAELLKARDEATVANAAKSRFLANMSHELRTPLNAVIGFSEMMRAQTFGPLGARKYLEYAQLISDSGHHLLALISDVLDISKVEAGRFKLSVERLKVRNVISECVQLMQVTALEEGLQLQTALGSDLPDIDADKRALKQILLNLLSNAIKFSAPGGSITVRATSNSAYLTLSVIGTGIGISQRDLARLGKPFEQVEDQFTKSKPGTGLGLSLVKALAELHSGFMVIDSAPGQGTRVTVRLPLRQSGAPELDFDASGQESMEMLEEFEAKEKTYKGAA